ncbi:DUF2752 domain-containing protein [Luteolibacter soli]|uniref:DUF2752 domain-containing protein n=1 Tax=Luteolibacter soli TaxID=3135280 RepID=A0ABU9AR75_9BACT
MAGALLLRGWISWWPTALPPCLVKHWTGLDCPGCGGTRCAVRLLQGDMAGALGMNAAVVLVAVSGVGVLGNAVWSEWHGRPAKGVPPWLAWSLAIFVVIFAVVRNLPWWPFTLLAPH